MNPLAFAAFLAWAVFDIYAASVLALKLPRVRFQPSRHTANAMRLIVIITIAANWLWLLRTHV